VPGFECPHEEGGCVSPSKLESFLQSFQKDTHLREFQEPVRDDLNEVETSIRKFFDSPIELVRGISQHLLGVTGKKFRPTLLLLVARLGQSKREDRVFGATVIELIHTATLIHDDTIDRSALRRGLPTINALYNDLVSTILGDYIYTKAFHELLQRDLPGVVEVVARTTYRMSIGEMLQLQQKNDLDLTEEAYFQLVDEKTASLMSAATEIGARIGGLDEERALRFRRFGEALGRAYQVTDDLFDFIGSPEVMGKGVRSDLAEGKVTLPLIHALARAGGRERTKLREIASNNAVGSEDWPALLAILESSGSIERCRETAVGLAETALALLREEEESPWRSALEKAVAYAVRRIH
jgi:octaprenyl-diphosphate synthase